MAPTPPRSAYAPALDRFVASGLVLLAGLFAAFPADAQRIPPGVADHGALTGLDRDDHSQYLLADGTRALTGSLSAAGHRIRGLAPAVQSGDAVPFQQAVKNGDGAGGDLAGAFPSPVVAGLRGRPVASTNPATGQVLTWTGSAWTPRALPAGGAGSAGGDLSGTFPSPVVAGLRGRPVAATSPAAGQVLTWTGSAWEPAAPASGFGDEARAELQRLEREIQELRRLNVALESAVSQLSDRLRRLEGRGS